MALFLLTGSSSSFYKRFYTVALISFILVCLCSYCSSSPFASSYIDADPLSDDLDEFDNNQEMKYFKPLQSLSNRYVNIPEQELLGSKARLFRILLKSLLLQPDYRYSRYNDKRYASQSFHAMRG
ncbi:unnamed protein product [Rotaria sp. Silwood2]|nr:unnamed protein product [Rotaria sp. Silwood2]CAF2672387.1 unnamed protein product [Rotaria sp. Silwood2]CAF2934584.1 unnamed protein product [Rotaria sp. Silwood2]CAF3085176.1 unnamed protein product [Rotaria sp. Silwood2]CAF3917675.1 unnamed protein product [Rotaria sp. Silwood2]